MNPTTIHLPDVAVTAAPLLFKRVLVVANDVKLVNDIRDTLDLRFCDVSAVDKAPEATRLLLAGNFDVVLCDMTNVTFPGRHFYEAVQRVRPQLAKRFISITDSAHSHLSLGAISIWKPLDSQLLLDGVDAILSKTGAPAPVPAAMRVQAGRALAASR